MRFLSLLFIPVFMSACLTIEESEDEKMTLPGNPGNKKIGWSMSGTLEQKNPLRQVSLQADFPHSSNYTAQFKLSGNLVKKKPFAEIAWSVEGNTVRRIISLADGVSIQGTAQAVSVKIYDDSPYVIIPGETLEYQASVQIVPGTRGSTSNPPTLDLYKPETLVAGAQHDFIVPSNAGIVSVAVLITPSAPFAVIPANSVVVSQLSAPPLIILGEYDPRQYFWVPLLPGCTDVYVTNNSAAEIKTKIIFGIDG